MLSYTRTSGNKPELCLFNMSAEPTSLLFCLMVIGKPCRKLSATAQQMSNLVLQVIRKAYGQVKVLHDIDVEMEIK